MAQNPQKGGLPAKKGFFAHFGQKSPKIAIFRKKCPVATGLKVPEMAKNGHFPQNRPKVGVPARGFTSTPARRGPDPGSGVRDGVRGLSGGPLPLGRARGPGPGSPDRDPGPLPGPRDPGGPETGLGGPSLPLGRGPEGLFYINPSRRGPAVPAGDLPGRPRDGTER